MMRYRGECVKKKKKNGSEGHDSFMKGPLMVEAQETVS